MTCLNNLQKTIYYLDYPINKWYFQIRILSNFIDLIRKSMFIFVYPKIDFYLSRGHPKSFLFALYVDKNGWIHEKVFHN